MLDNPSVIVYNLCGYEKSIQIPLPNRSEGGNLMSQVRVKENESLDSALRRFKRQTSRDGIIQEVRKREHYEKPSVARKRRARLLVKESTNKLHIICGSVSLRSRFFLRR